MDKKVSYTQIIIDLVEKIAFLGVKPDNPVQPLIIKDREQGHYLIFSNGWRNTKRIYGCYLHIEVKEDGKVWLHHDGTDMVIAQKMIDRGIPKSDIVLGFHAPFVRQDTEFAIA